VIITAVEMDKMEMQGIEKGGIVAALAAAGSWICFFVEL